MLRFEPKRIHKVTIIDSRFSKPIPVVSVDPKKEDKNTVVFVYSGGIGSSIPSCLFMDNFVYNNNYFVTYDKAGHGENTNKTSQFKKPYLNELDAVVNWVRQQLPDRKVYLLGESWGTAIAMLYYGKNKDKVQGVVGWNMPLSIVNTEKLSKKQLFKIAMLELGTLLFNVENHLPKIQSSQDKYSRDPLFRRLLMLVPPAKTNTRINISIWRYMRPFKNFIKKFGTNPNYNFLYIQSGEDVMANWKKLNKLEKYLDSNHYIKFPTGYHVLAMEPVESKDLYDRVLEFIKK